jgi:hypothetical protein
MKNLQSKAQKLADYAEAHLSLETAQLSRAYFYQSLPFCIIDAVFSLGVKYRQVENVVSHVAKVTGWDAFRPHSSNFPAIEKQKTVSDLLEEIGKHQDTSKTLFDNRGYANPSATKVPKIKKSDLINQFAGVLKQRKIETFQYLKSYEDSEALDNELRALPALKSGVGVRYFRMLAGDENQVKPDRMIQRFIEAGIGESLSVDMCASLVQETCGLLKTRFRSLTPRLLDHEIWKFQRQRKQAKHD